MSIEEYKKEYSTYFLSEYKKILKLDTVSNKETQKFLNKFDLSTASHFTRLMGIVRNLKQQFVFTKSDITVICFKVTIGSSTCIYAYLYARCEIVNGESIMKYLYLSTGPTYTSQDKETLFKER
jgi:hypothetical protein